MTTKDKLLTALLTLSLTSSVLNAFGFEDVTNALASQPTTASKATSSSSITSSLTSMLTSKLGVSGKQASGGLGSILSYAKSSLSSEKFSTLSNAVPDAKKLISLAPTVSDKLGGLTSSFGSQGKSLSSLASLGSQFSSLGMNSEMISKFVPIIMSYFKSSGSSDAGSILTSLFKK
ncbi:DUF2780 domain-containing protein [Sulfurimonas sp.]